MLESFCPSVKTNIRDFGKYDKCQTTVKLFQKFNLVFGGLIFQKRTSRIIMFKNLSSMNNSTFSQSSPKQPYDRELDLYLMSLLKVHLNSHTA